MGKGVGVGGGRTFWGGGGKGGDLKFRLPVVEIVLKLRQAGEIMVFVGGVSSAQALYYRIIRD